jgi:hypothetical protein
MSRATVFAISSLRKLIAANGVKVGAPSSYRRILGRRRPFLGLTKERTWVGQKPNAEKAAMAERCTGKAYSTNQPGRVPRHQARRERSKFTSSMARDKIEFPDLDRA